MRKKLQHFILGSEYIHPQDFKSRSSREKSIPERNIIEHAQNLSLQYDNAIKSSKCDIKLAQLDKRPVANGYYLELEVDNSLNKDKLQKVQGPRVMSIRNEESNNFKATVYLPSDKSDWLRKALPSYQEKGKNKALFNSIESIHRSKIRDFFLNRDDQKIYDSLLNESTEKIELWFSKDETIPYNKKDIVERLIGLGIRIISSFLEFSTCAVVLVQISKSQLDQLPITLNLLGEVRVFKDASLLTKGSLKNQAEWSNLLSEDLELANNPVLVGVLDTGIRTGNSLLDPFIPQEFQKYSVSDNSYDRENHGTLMAVLILHGDLTQWLYSPEKHRVYSNIISIKCKPAPDETSTLPELYGVVIEDAISKSRNLGAIINCSAITGERISDGKPTSWSGAIDEILFNQGRSNELLILSAGNVEETQGLEYPEFNLITPPKDPNQSWNAISVGALTRKVGIIDKNYIDRKPLASFGQISPYTPCSQSWNLVKPDIIMEGGNALDSGGYLSPAVDELNMVSPCVKSTGEKFDCMYATSGASALAARLASIIQHEHPKLSALAIRGLMIHSAEWSKEMKDQFLTTEGKIDKDGLLNACGYGEPDLGRAVASYNNAATFIIERDFSPFTIGDDKKLKAKSMDVIELPWPKDLFVKLGNVPVKVKLTLSYYIQPSPGSNQYKYESFALRFDMNNVTETREQFIQRISNITCEEVEKTKNRSSRWGIGISRRNKGSISSDFIETNAIDCAYTRFISVYPVNGWWNKRKWTDKKAPIIKYALLVTIETPEEDIDIYSAIKNIIQTPIKIET